MSIDSILKNFQLAEGERQRLEPIFDDAIRLTMPARKRFRSTQIDTAEDIFDETGANAVTEFVSRMQAGMTPPFTDFVKLEASEAVDPKDREAVNRDLEDIQKYAFEQIWASNFAQEAAESFHDLAISTGIMCVEESFGEAPIVNRAIPITDAYLQKGPDDRIGAVYRKAMVKAADLELRYRGAKLSDKLLAMAAREQDRELEIIEVTRRDYSKREPTFYHEVIVKEDKTPIINRTLTGAGSNPFIAFRWNTASGETWGRGPVLNALAAIRTTNLMVELVLENAAMSIVGMYQTDNDGIVNADNISLIPGTIITKELGSQGLEPIKPATGNFNMRDVVLSDQRLNIKRALFNDMLSDPNKTPATATEVAERMADLAYRTAAGFSRVHYEFVVPYMRRVLHLLEKRNEIELPVKNGRALAFRAISPLAQAQNGRELQSLAQDFQLRAAIWGPQVASSMYELKELHPWLMSRMGVSEKVYASTADILKGLEEQAQMMAEMQQQQQPQQTTMMP